MVVVFLLCAAAAAGEVVGGVERGGQTQFGTGDVGGRECDRQPFTIENYAMGCLFQKEVYSVKDDLSCKQSRYEEMFNVNFVENRYYVDCFLSLFGMELEGVISDFDGMAGVVTIGISLSSMRIETLSGIASAVGMPTRLGMSPRRSS